MESQSPLRIAHRLLLIFLIASFLFSLYSIFARNTSPRMSMGGWGTDHISHAHATVLFYYRGLDIYRYPVQELLEYDQSEAAQEYARDNDLLPRGYDLVPPDTNEVPSGITPLPDELFRLPERRRHDVPVFLNWPQLARVYPPGLYVYELPEALMLECTALPLWVVNAFTICKFSIVAHVLLWFFGSALIVRHTWTNEPATKIYAVLLIGVFFFVQVQVCLWTLSGFYDGLAVLFLVLLVVHVQRQQWNLALFFFALAVIFHFRSLWYFPLVCLAGFQMWKSGLRTVLSSRRQMLLLAVTVALLAVSGAFFLLAFPSMRKFPLTNEMHYTRLLAGYMSWQLLIVPVLLGLLIMRREWLLLSATAGALLFLFNTPQLQHWHSLFLIPLLLCTRDTSARGLLIGSAMYAGLAVAFFQLGPFDPRWIGFYYGY